MSFLELFYDLVYVVLVGRTAHTLAHHVSWSGFTDFIVIFGLIWIGWLNGTLYHDLHGREDGRSRTFMFLQMLVLSILAVFTGEAAGGDGRGFAVTYVLLLLMLTWLGYTVRREDNEAYMAITGIYLIAMLVSAVVTGISVFVSDDLRIILWALIVVG